MSNEILTKLMDPLEKGYNVNVAGLVGSEGFGDKERKEELCTLAAKWYLDASGGDRTTETKKIPTLDELETILADENAHEIYMFKTEDWKKAIGALGADKVPVGCLYPDAAEPYVWDSSVSIQNMVWDYFKNHVADILAKIQEIQEARNAHAIADKEQENTETKKSEHEIPEDLKKLRDPLNTENINICDLLPIPAYGTTTEVTPDDFVMWCAKHHVKEHGGISEEDIKRVLRKRFDPERVVHLSRSDLQKLYSLFGLEMHLGWSITCTLDMENHIDALYKQVESQIISKVKEIMKLWIEHDLI